MYKSIFILPLPIEIQYLIFKYEHNFKFKSVLNDIEKICYVCKYPIDNPCYSSPCFQIYIGNLLVLNNYTHYKHKYLEKLKYDVDIIKKVCNEHNIRSLYHEVKIKYTKSNKFIII